MSHSEAAAASRELFRDGHGNTAATQPVSDADVSATPRIPDYLERTYRWAYLDERNAKFLDHEFIVRTILWQQHRRLERAAFAEIEPGQHVIQAACVYGTFSTTLANHIGPSGRLEIIDVARVQVDNCRRKLAGFDNVTVRQQNLVDLRGETADIVCCYFLLHELPADYKKGVAAALLDSVRPGGKVVFVDYHKPHWAHPVKPVTSLIFERLEPFAKELWSTEIAAYGNHDARFSWRKETYFGGLFQKVVATHVPQ